MLLGPEELKGPLVGHLARACWPLVTDLADPGHPGMDVPPLPLPGFHGRLSEEDVDLVIVWVVGVRDAVGADERGLCKVEDQHNTALRPEPTLPAWECTWKALGAGWDAEGIQGAPWRPCYPVTEAEPRS